ncbi:hypothetical protein [Alteromonas sp. A079]|uniref:hypothetical protein n=1 Tax=Alteromonas sp. A079 TaxID=3410268 RepID=UPI003B9EF91D
MFEQHGNFNVFVVNNTITLTLEGAWNVETSLAYQQEIREKARHLKGSPFGVLTLLNDWELCTPECEKVLVEIVQTAISWGMQKEAVINDTGAAKLLLFEKHKHLHINDCKEDHFHRRIFSQKSDAVSWLASAGFHLDDT